MLQLCDWLGGLTVYLSFLRGKRKPWKEQSSLKNQFIDRWPIDDTVILCILMHKLANEWVKWYRYLERKDKADVKNKSSFTFKNTVES